MQNQFSNLKINTPIEIFLEPLDKNYQSKKIEIWVNFSSLRHISIWISNQIMIGYIGWFFHDSVKKFNNIFS